MSVAAVSLPGITLLTALLLPLPPNRLRATAGQRADELPAPSAREDELDLALASQRTAAEFACLRLVAPVLSGRRIGGAGDRIAPRADSKPWSIGAEARRGRGRRLNLRSGARGGRTVVATTRGKRKSKRNQGASFRNVLHPVAIGR
jgi:hypothetical protein